MTQLYLALDMVAFRERQQRLAVKSSPIGKAVSRGNVSFDGEQKRANLVRELKFRPRWFGVERVDEPSAEFIDLALAKAVAADLATIFQAAIDETGAAEDEACPGSVEIVRLRRAVAPGHYTAEHEVWLQMLATNQGERLRDLMADAGVPKAKVAVSVRFATPDAPASLMFANFFSTGQETGQAQEAPQDAEEAQAQAIAKRGLVAFSPSLGRIDIVKYVSFKPRHFTNEDAMDDPCAEPADPALAAKVLGDMFQIWQIYKAPAIMFAEVMSKSSDLVQDQWTKALAFNRAVFCRQELVKMGFPEELLYPGSTGHEPSNFPPVPGSSGGDVCAGGVSAGGAGRGGAGRRAPSEEPGRFAGLCSTSPTSMTMTGSINCSGGSGGSDSPRSPASPRAPRGTVAATRLRLRHEMQRAAVMQSVDAIPLLEEIAAQARDLGLSGAGSRCDPLLGAVEDQLKVLKQRRRRQEAWTASKDRNQALAHVKLAYVKRNTFIDQHPQTRAPTTPLAATAL